MLASLAFDNESSPSYHEQKEKTAAPSELIYHLHHSTDTKGNHSVKKTYCGKDSAMPYTEMVPASTWDQVPPAQKCKECDHSYQSGAPKTAAMENDLTRCNECMNVFDEDQLELLPDGPNEWMKVCPVCHTDEALMQMATFYAFKV